MSTRIIEQKVILCGEYNVGKSSLFRRFVTNEFIPSSAKPSTIGLDFFTKSFQTRNNSITDVTSSTTASFDTSQSVKLQLWDTGGMERVASVTSSYYKFSEGALLVFALDSSDSFNALAQHLIEVVSYAENAKIFICGNKSDLTNQEITDEDIEMFCEQCGTLISGVYKTSCKTGEGVQLMFEDIAKVLHDSNKSRLELQSLNASHPTSFKLDEKDYEQNEDEKDCSSSC
jgi:small GTP-binding protein